MSHLKSRHVTSRDVTSTHQSFAVSADFDLNTSEDVGTNDVDVDVEEEFATCRSTSSLSRETMTSSPVEKLCASAESDHHAMSTMNLFDVVAAVVLGDDSVCTRAQDGTEFTRRNETKMSQVDSNRQRRYDERHAQPVLRQAPEVHEC